MTEQDHKINEKSPVKPWPPGYGNGSYDEEADVNKDKLESANMFPPLDGPKPNVMFPYSDLDPEFEQDLENSLNYLRGKKNPCGEIPAQTEPVNVDMGGSTSENVLKDEEVRVDTKETNPKDAVGVKKWRQYCTVPTTVIWELGVAMLEGARKYGRHNYRVAGVRGSVYVDAAKGHIDQWWEGEDIDAESGLNHITKAMASLAVMRDAMIHDKFVDDRPPKTNLNKLRTDLQIAVDGIFERIPVAKDAFLEGDQHGE